MTVHRRTRLMIGLAAVAVVATACGTSSGGNAPSKANVAATKPAGSAAMVATRSGPLGTYLTDGHGRSVYLFARDTRGRSMCTGACTDSWPPYTTSGAASAGGTAKSGDIGTIRRSDGSMQVTYAGHPLYYYDDDKKAGDTEGQGETAFGGVWTLVTPAGGGIAARSSEPSPSSSDSSSGYSY